MMSDLIFTVTYPDGTTDVIDDLYWFEENGIRQIKGGVAEGSFCGKYKIEFHRFTEMQRQNELLRAVAEAAKTFGNKAVLFPGYYTVSFQHGNNLILATQAAIDGGALENQ